MLSRVPTTDVSMALNNLNSTGIVDHHIYIPYTAPLFTENPPMFLNIRAA